MKDKRGPHPLSFFLLCLTDSLASAAASDNPKPCALTVPSHSCWVGCLRLLVTAT